MKEVEDEDNERTEEEDAGAEKKNNELKLETY